MHEMSIAESVRAIVESSARRAGLASVSVVRVEVGRLAAVEPEALRFCFAAVMKGGVAEHARLEIRESGGEAWCLRCSRAVQVASRVDACPACGSAQLQVSGGDALRVLELQGD